MRYSPDHKFHAHVTRTEVAARLAKQEGFAATSLRRFMAASGHTTGAFYALFDCKEQLLLAIVEEELLRTLRGFSPPTMPGYGLAPSLADKHSATGLRDALAAYLHPAHIEDLAGGCLLPALAAEIGRADLDTRRACERGLQRIQQTLTDSLGDTSAAWAVLSQAVGTVLLARTMATGHRRQEILTSSLTQLHQHYRLT